MPDSSSTWFPTFRAWGGDARSNGGSLFLLMGSLVAYPWWARRRVAQEAMLFQMLASSIAQGLPLTATVVHALGHQSRGQWGAAALRLGDQLEAGVPLQVALSNSPRLVSRDALVRIRSAPADRLGETLQQLARESRGQASPTHVGLLFYLIMVFVLQQGILTFMLYYIVPKFHRIFQDFGVKLPPMTQQLLWGLDVIGPILPLFSEPLCFVLMWSWYAEALTGWTLRFGIGSQWLRFLWLRLETPPVLRMLAESIGGQQPISDGLVAAAQETRNLALRRKLLVVASDVSAGRDVWDVLRTTDLIKPPESRLLSAAGRAGNLRWMLLDLADRMQQARTAAILTGLEVVCPIAVLGLGLMVGYFVIGFFLPLVQLIHELA